MKFSSMPLKHVCYG